MVLSHEMDGRVLAASVAALTYGAACSLTSLDGFTGDGGGPPAGDGGVAAADAPSPSGEDAEAGADDPASLYRAAVLDDGPISYFRFEEGGGSVAKDERGAHHGTYELAPTLDEPGILGGRGILFPKDSNAHMRAETTAFRFAGNAAFTIELWVKPAPGNQVYQWVLSTESSSDPRLGWSLWTAADGTLNYEVWGGTRFNSPALESKLTNGVFHHVVVAYNGRAILGYLDGENDFTQQSEGAAADAGDVLILGCRLAGSALDFCLDDWVIDELALYDHVLSPTRIGVHRALGIAR